MVTVAEALEAVRQKLRVSGCSDHPSIEAQWILEKVSGKHRSEMLTHPETMLSEFVVTKAETLAQQYVNGHPLPYVLGEWYFCGLPFEVNPSVLIPRPETELLVETALDWLRDKPEDVRIADIGTGSGCIAISLLSAKHCVSKRVVATDRSFKALETARENAKRNGVADRIRFVQGNLSSFLTAGLNLVCANLPYIPTDRIETLDVSRHEPLLALDGGMDGFEFYRSMLEDLSWKLVSPWLILCEIDFTHTVIAQKTADRFFPQAEVSIERDLAGMSRLLVIRGQANQ